MIRGADVSMIDVLQPKKYRAFISYSHTDRSWADWLHNALERYRIPRYLSGTDRRVPRRLSPIFLDRTELGASQDLDLTIREALRDSDALVVICSPSAALSQRVNQEIASFAKFDSGRVLAFIISGRPDSAQRGGEASEECLPAALRDLRQLGSDVLATPLAADARRGKGGRHEALLILVAGILDLNLDLLRQRDLRRRRQLWTSTVALLLTGLLGALMLSIYALSQRDAALQSQAQLLTEIAFERMKDGDIATAQHDILRVLTDRSLNTLPPVGSVNVFEEIQAADPRIAVLGPLRDRIVTAFYSGDGSRVVTASLDRTVRIWDARSFAELAVLRGHRDRVDYAIFSPGGSQVVSASGDGTARIWDVRTGKQVAILTGHSAPLRKALYSADGELIVTASFDNSAKIWNAHTGELLASLKGHTDRVSTVAFSPDSSRVLTASFDNTAKIWDSATGRLLTTLKGHSDRLFSAAFSSDGALIVTASRDKTPRVWDARTGNAISVLLGHDDTVRAAAFSPDGTRIATASQDGTGRIWEAPGGRQLAVMTGHSGWVIFAAYSADGTQIVTTSSDRTVRTWNAQTGAQVSLLIGHKDHVLSAVFSPDGSQLLSASEDGTARVWEAIPGAARSTVSAFGELINRADFSPDGSHIVVASQGNVARIRTIHDGVTRMELVGHRDMLTDAKYSQDGREIITSSRDGTARIWNAATGTVLATLLGHKSSVESAAFSHDGLRAVTASQDNTARVWNSVTGAPLGVLTGHPDRLNFALFSQDDTRIVTSSFDQTARTWEVRTGHVLQVFAGHTMSVNTAVFSLDGSLIVTASDDNTARIWNSQSGAQVMILSGHRSAVNYATFSHDGLRVITASADRTARMWDTRTGTPLAILNHGGGVNSVEFSSDDHQVLTGSADKTTRIWHVEKIGNLPEQIAWYQAAEFENVSDSAEKHLALVAAQATSARDFKRECNRLAAAPYDPDRQEQGVELPDMLGELAVSACSKAALLHEKNAQIDYELGRALTAQNDSTGARRALQSAVANGYRAARIDLAELLSGSKDKVDQAWAKSLYEEAWKSGVLKSAFALGQYYELPTCNEDCPRCHPDLVKAWDWYKRGAESREPYALARFGQRADEVASASDSLSVRTERLLDAFSFFTAAIEEARKQNWSVRYYLGWQNRRASLAHVLARDASVEVVGNAYMRSQKLLSLPTLVVDTSQPRQVDPLQ